MKECLKSVSIWRRSGQKFGDMFFLFTVYMLATGATSDSLTGTSANQINGKGTW